MRAQLRHRTPACAGYRCARRHMHRGTPAISASRIGRRGLPLGRFARPDSRAARRCARRSLRPQESASPCLPHSSVGALRSRPVGAHSPRRTSACGGGPLCGPSIRLPTNTAAAAAPGQGRRCAFRSALCIRPAAPGHSADHRLVARRSLAQTGPPAHPDPLAGHRSTSRDGSPCVSADSLLLWCLPSVNRVSNRARGARVCLLACLVHTLPWVARVRRFRKPPPGGLGGDRSHRGPSASTYRASPPAAFTIATMPARSAGGRSGHAATTDANSGSPGIGGGVGAPGSPRLLPDLLPRDSAIAVFPEENREGSSSSWAFHTFGKGDSQRSDGG